MAFDDEKALKLMNHKKINQIKDFVGNTHIYSNVPELYILLPKVCQMEYNCMKTK